MPKYDLKDPNVLTHLKPYIAAYNAKRAVKLSSPVAKAVRARRRVAKEMLIQMSTVRGK